MALGEIHPRSVGMRYPNSFGALGIPQAKEINQYIPLGNVNPGCAGTRGCFTCKRNQKLCRSVSVTAGIYTIPSIIHESIQGE